MGGQSDATNLFKWNAQKGGYERLAVDYDRMVYEMISNGGLDVFGSWSDWGDIFNIRAAQLQVRSPFDIADFLDDIFCREAHGANDAAGQGHAASAYSVYENVINVEALDQHVMGGAARPEQAQAFLMGVKAHGVESTTYPGLWRIKERFEQKPWYGRSSCVDPNGMQWNSGTARTFVLLLTAGTRWT